MWHKDVFMHTLNHAYFTDWWVHVCQNPVTTMFVQAFPLGRGGLVPAIYKPLYTTGGILRLKSTYTVALALVDASLKKHVLLVYLQYMP